MKRNIVFAGIGSALAVLVLVGAGCSSEELAAALSEDLEARVEEVGQDVVGAFAGDSEEETENTQTYYDYYPVSEYESDTWSIEKMEELGAEGFITLGIVENPVKKDLVYFATSRFTQPPSLSNTVRLYEHSSSSDSVRELHEFYFQEGDAPVETITKSILPGFNLLGITVDDSGNPTEFIGLIKDTDDSPGGCTKPLILNNNQGVWSGKREIVALSSTDFTFTPHIVPGELIERLMEEIRDCLDELNN